MKIVQPQGMTLVELLLCIGVIALLAAVSIPTITDLYSKHQLTRFSSELVHGIHFARQIALSEQKRVTLCPLNTDNRCHKNWSAPLSIFVDNEGMRRLQSPSDLIGRIDQPANLTVRWKGMGGGHALHFNGRGLTAVSNGTFLISTSTSVSPRRIIINRQGRARTERGDE